MTSEETECKETESSVDSLLRFEDTDSPLLLLFFAELYKH